MTAPRKIIFFMHFAERLGGGENTLWSVLQGLDRSRFAPLVVFAAEGAFRQEVEAIGIPTTVIEPGRLRQVLMGTRAIGRIARLLRREQPDLIVSWLTKSHVYVVPAAWIAGVGDRVVWWQHLMPTGDRLDRVATALPARAIGTYAEHVAAAQREVWPHRRTVVARPGIDTPHPASDADIAALRARLEIPPDALVVGIVGRLQPWKGQDRFLRAVALVRERGFAVHALVVGGNAHGFEPEYPGALRELSVALGLEGHVTFTGQVAPATPYLQLMDATVNASVPEPFGLVVVEALALGVPVVAVDAAGPREIVGTSGAGALVPTGSPEDLADGIERVLGDPEGRERMVELGRAHYAATYTAERAAADMDRCLTELSEPPTG